MTNKEGNDPFFWRMRMRKVQNKLDERLNYIRSLILNMGAFVEKTISSSCDILLKTADSGIMKELTEREENINQLQLRVSRVCFKILARESPVAGDLRLILAIVSANTDLERMGDLALNIAEKAQSVKKDPMIFLKTGDDIRHQDLPEEDTYGKEGGGI